MKQLVFALAALLSVAMHAQVPQGIPYQAVLRDAQGNPSNNQTVEVKFSLHDTTADGVVVYEETHATTTNAIGLFSLTFGAGVATVGNFASINWSNGFKFLQVQTNIGNGYVDNGTQQLMSVPYALHAQTATTQVAGNGISHVSEFGDTLYLSNGNFLIIPGISYPNLSAAPHSCGALNVHNWNKTYGSIEDEEGNIYKTIIIGNQEWMAENLNTGTYRNGDAILTNLDNSAWQNTTDGAWAYLFNDQSNECPYGKLYNWYTIQDSRGVCPIDWHVPSEEEWIELYEFLATFPNTFLSSNPDFQLQSTGGTYWDMNCQFGVNANATNTSGFSALAGGARTESGQYSRFLCASALFWGSSDINSDAYYRILEAGVGNWGGGFYGDKNQGFSIRCIKD
jgi:uncharacterized protein (TIGR02145 family)